jgi:hypothetical protein
MHKSLAIIGGGPAGLAAAEAAAQDKALVVTIYDAMPSVGRKFLMAGKGGLNLSHSEPLAKFLARYGAREKDLAPAINRFGPEELVAWARGLGVATFVGSSGRIFPEEMKAAPLLRAWVRRLKAMGVVFKTRHRWLGWNANALRFATLAGEIDVAADAVVLALGGASWPQLGSDAAWVPLLAARGIPVATLKPANCGFDVGWSAHFRERFAGEPLKPVTAWTDAGARHRGECIVTATGLEGGVVYALARVLRDAIDRDGTALLMLDLAPGLDAADVTRAITRPRGKLSLATHLRRAAGIAGVKAGLLREALSAGALADPAQLARAVKACPVRLTAPRPIGEVISTAGGVDFAALDEAFMVRSHAGLFVCGEMLDWEAPTGGYLLTACFATGRAAGEGAAAWLKR